MAVASSYATCLIGLLIFLFTITSSTATRDVKALDLDAHFDTMGISCEVNSFHPEMRDALLMYPGIYGPDVKDAGSILIDAAKFNAVDAKNEIMGLFPEAPHAQRLLGKKDYTGLHREAGIFIKYASDCNESFKPEQSPLKMENKFFFNGIDMILAFSYLLIHQ
ncbi:hypothetical protein MKX03_010028 [Papaver bracteatum]|nr:hypothetical protein MKX03_010028 [Papaver bracteatum]